LQKIILITYFVLLFSFITTNTNAQIPLDKEIESIKIRLLEKIDNISVENIAVADFADADEVSTKLGRYLANEFSFALASASAEKNFNVIDRSKMKFLLEENGLAKGGLIDPNTVAKLGKIKGIDAIITGTLTPASDYIRVFINVIELETAKVLVAIKGDISKNPTITLNEVNLSEITPSSPIEIDKGLIAYYPFNGNANDESKNNNNCTVYGATLTQNRFGNENLAYDFDGKDDFIEVIAVSDEFKSIADFTLSLWIYFRRFEKKINSEDKFRQEVFIDRQYLFNGNTSSKTAESDFLCDGFNLGLNWLINDSNESLFGSVSKSKSELATIESVIPLKNDWTHLVLMRKNGDIYLYVNGLKKSREKSTVGNMDMLHNLFIGTSCGNNPSYQEGKFNFSFNGKMDDVAIYNRALSNEEILQLSSDK